MGGKRRDWCGEEDRWEGSGRDRSGGREERRMDRREENGRVKEKG